MLEELILLLLSNFLLALIKFRKECLDRIALLRNKCDKFLPESDKGFNPVLFLAFPWKLGEPLLPHLISTLSPFVQIVLLVGLVTVIVITMRFAFTVVVCPAVTEIISS